MFKVTHFVTVLPLSWLITFGTNDSDLFSLEKNSDEFSVTKTVYVSSKFSPNIRSVYTDINLENCETIKTYEEIGGWQKRCSGYKEIPVFIKELDGRYFVGVGRKVEISNPSLPFNHLGEKMEWRLQDDQPFAVIYRYYIDDPNISSPSSILAVAKIATEQEDGCVIALVYGDVRNANKIARNYADEKTASFQCGMDPSFIHINEFDRETTSLKLVTFP